jgi:hypothetical protein
MHAVPAGRLAHPTASETPRPVEGARHGVVYRDPFAYCAHPQIARLPDGAWLLVVRGGLPNRDLGYPTSTVTTAGDVFTVYYCQDRSGVTGIEATTFRI